MSRDQDSLQDADFTENIIDIDVASEMEGSFLEYAYSVIYSRALPDARDGLKPVQRRILYMMAQMGLRPERGHVKSSRVVGEVMGKLHPHGDSAIYDAMVRLAQSFSLRLPLVDGHGNFGSLDDGPAASRYTEAKLAPAALAMTTNLDEDVVDFVPNYDNSQQQPEVLPAAFPNLLVNGASGIAVGMATNMAPHNLVEVVGATKHLIQNPDAELSELMKFIPGPDLPSGGIIAGTKGIKDAYKTGRGIFKTRAKVALEKVSARKTALVVTELPYLVGPEKVIDRIKAGVTAKKLSGIANVIDLTDRKNGLKLVIELKSGFNPNSVLAALYKHTPMEESFGINNVALVNGQPLTLGLKEMLEVYVDHRLNVVRRRTEHRLAKRRERLHLVEGLLIAILNIDEVIQIIRGADQASQARERLMLAFDLTETQANHILELRLRQLTKYSRIELEAEQDELKAAIAELEAILASDRLLRELVCAELDEVVEKFGDERRTVLQRSEDLAPLAGTTPAAPQKSAGKATGALQIADDPCFVVLTKTGLIVRTANRSTEFTQPRRYKHDLIAAVIPTSARSEVGALLTDGTMLRVPVIDLPVTAITDHAPRFQDAVNANDFIGLAKNETLLTLVPLDQVLAMGTTSGVVKRLSPDYPLNRDRWEAITLKGADTLVGAAACPDDAELVFITRNAQLLRTEAEKIRPQGRTAGGVAGMRVAESDEVIHFGVVTAAERAVGARVVTITNPVSGDATHGTVKITDLNDFPLRGRATAGIRAHRFLKGEDRLALAGTGATTMLGSTKAGVARTLPLELAGRDASGIPLSHKIDLLAGTVVAPAATAKDGKSAGEQGTLEF
ncbi:DNA gyrase/topoisomerase IV subunit A [Micrococcoides hystricis]|uniref:DNA topoisomerase (ATP-hydrolyzing) n=1 Tax=Micrococcoides hystricis TaxID=1572761 RepID=A0ABV6P6V9_9MICC